MNRDEADRISERPNAAGMGGGSGVEKIWAPICPECGADGRSIRAVQFGKKCKECNHVW